jgi:uncharacterized damage-inducible protein DinB
MTASTTDLEKAALLSALGNQRKHILGILEGLSDEALHRPVLPSGWTCVGMVRHLALDVERFWFRNVFAGEPTEAAEVVADSWHVPGDVTGEAVFDLYRKEIERSNAIVAAAALDTPPANWPAFWPNWRLDDIRAILLHVITETAVHCGHLDAVRELIDGRQWLVLQ